MKTKHERFLKQLLETPSPTGYEVPVADVVRERLSGTADEIRTDVMGSVHALLKGNADGPSLMLAAHMDEIGLHLRRRLSVRGGHRRRRRGDPARIAC